jgi:hypothetical protein
MSRDIADTPKEKPDESFKYLGSKLWRKPLDLRLLGVLWRLLAVVPHQQGDDRDLQRAEPEKEVRVPNDVEGVLVVALMPYKRAHLVEEHTREKKIRVAVIYGVHRAVS